ncbi:MAG: type I 3-dehydroquinate dehydratase [bacterium]|nr:type I 3-dehydroquinate dehydratase [bacterium]
MICIPIRQKKISSLLKRLTEAQKTADLVELWLDEIEINETNLNKIFKVKKKPFIYKVSEGSKNIEKILSKGNKIEYIDLDLQSPKSIIGRVKKLSCKTKIIISFHDFEKTPSDSELGKISRKILSKGADIVKIATQARNLSDSLRMLNFLKKLSDKKQDSICVCMGKEGKITRLAGHLFGNYLMYAPLNKKDSTADGQITISELKKIYGS